MGFWLARFNLDDLMASCYVAEVGHQAVVKEMATNFIYHVLYGRMIAGPSHIAVVQASEKPFGVCYFCAYETTGRVVLENDQHLASEIIVCCRACYDIGRSYQGRGGLVEIGRVARRVRHYRDGFTPTVTAGWVRADARYRERLFPSLIAHARAQNDWPEEVPAIPWKAYYRWLATEAERQKMRRELLERRSQGSVAAAAQPAADNRRAARPQLATTPGRRVEVEVDYIDDALERWSA
jgi:hypothetical protein